MNKVKTTHQVLDPSLQFCLGQSNGILGSHDDDDLAVGVFLSWEDDPGTGLVSDALNVSALTADQELVMLGLGSDLCDAAGQLLLVRHVHQHLFGFLNIVLRSADGHLIKQNNLVKNL